jgi:hypothetical protein
MPVAIAATAWCVPDWTRVMSVAISLVALDDRSASRRTFSGNNREPASLVARPRSLDRRVERKQVGLRSDLVDRLHDRPDLLPILPKLINRRTGLLNGHHDALHRTDRLAYCPLALDRRAFALVGRTGNPLRGGRHQRDPIPHVLRLGLGLLRSRGVAARGRRNLLAPRGHLLACCRQMVGASGNLRDVFGRLLGQSVQRHRRLRHLVDGGGYLNRGARHLLRRLAQLV